VEREIKKVRGENNYKNANNFFPPPVQIEKKGNQKPIIVTIRTIYACSKIRIKKEEKG